MGTMPFLDAWALQKKLVDERILHLLAPDILLLTEHPPVYTLGTGASLEFVKFDLTHPAYEIHRIERGGEVTYHCPGQIVGYPILNLGRHQQDLHWYLRQLEAVVIETVKKLGLSGTRIPGLTGVWVQERKIAAIGIKVRRWITSHGFALNVCPDLAGFQRIVPCGIRDRPVGSLAEFIPEIQTNEVQSLLIQSFGEVFGVTPQLKTSL